MQEENQRVRCVLSYDDAQDASYGRDIKITFVCNDKTFSQTYFNFNAFNLDVSDEVIICSERFANIFYYLKLLKWQLLSDKRLFINSLLNKKLKLNEALEASQKDRFIAYYDGIEVSTCLSGFLFYIKSFLDSFSILICKSFNKKQYVEFNKKIIGNKKLAGGRLIDWLRQCTPNIRNQKGISLKIADIIESNSISWINDCVIYRDKISHKSGIPTFLSMRVPLYQHKPYFFENEIKLPYINDNMEVFEYCQSISKKLQLFVKDILQILPNVNIKLLNFWEHNIEEPVWG